MKIIFGWTPKIDYIYQQNQIDNLEEKLKNELEYDMKNGYTKMLPGFIGELIISKPFEDYYEKTLIDISYYYHRDHNFTPIFLNLGANLDLIPTFI